jgi:hypothetical protein
MHKLQGKISLSAESAEIPKKGVVEAEIYSNGIFFSLII